MAVVIDESNSKFENLTQNLAELALALGLDKYILFSHGPDLCHDSELRHAMANCFEAFLGSIFLDGGINVADKVNPILLLSVIKIMKSKKLIMMSDNLLVHHLFEVTIAMYQIEPFDSFVFLKIRDTYII